MSRQPINRVLVVGFGSAGRRHLGNLRALGRDVAVVCRTPEQAAAAAQNYGVRAFGSLLAAKSWDVEAVVVATPTSRHRDDAAWAIRRGCHVLVEKPFSDRIDGLDALTRDAEARQLCVAIASNLRFHPALEAVRATIGSGAIGRLLSARAEVGQYLPDWHPEEDYRRSYSGQRRLGGGALLTLLHELDYTMWIAGDVKEAVGLCGRVSTLDINVEDVAEIVCRHHSGVLSSVHMDFIDRSYHRRSRWICEDGTIEWRWGMPAVLRRPDGSVATIWEDQDWDFNQTYVRELEDFLAAAATGTVPRASGREGLRVLQTALGVRRDVARAVGHADRRAERAL